MQILDNSLGRLLLVTAERVGDAIFLTPAVALLKRALPEVQIDILALSKAAANVFQYNPHINQIWITNKKLKIRRISRQYPLVLNLMYEMQKYLSNLPTHSLSIPKPSLDKHRAHHVIDFVLPLIKKSIEIDIPSHYELYPQEVHSQSIRALLAQQNVDVENHILIGCQLGCHRVARRGWKIWNRKRHRHTKVWPLENYISLAKKLSEYNSNIRFIITGSEEEKFLGKMFVKEFPSTINFIGQTNLFEVTALMKFLSVFITHDTGTLHIACSQNTPVIALFGPTPVAFTGPFPINFPSFTVMEKNPIEEISLEEVFDATKKKIFIDAKDFPN